jgi:hypothetical protein
VSCIRLSNRWDALEFEPDDAPIVIARMDKPPQGKPLGGEWETLGDVRFLRGSATTENKNLLVYEDQWIYRPAYPTDEGGYKRAANFMLEQCPNLPFDSDLEHTIE